MGRLGKCGKKCVAKKMAAAKKGKGKKRELGKKGKKSKKGRKLGKKGKKSKKAAAKKGKGKKRELGKKGKGKEGKKGRKLGKKGKKSKKGRKLGGCVAGYWPFHTRYTLNDSKFGPWNCISAGVPCAMATSTSAAKTLVKNDWKANGGQSFKYIANGYCSGEKSGSNPWVNPSGITWRFSLIRRLGKCGKKCMKKKAAAKRKLGKKKGKGKKGKGKKGRKLGKKGKKSKKGKKARRLGQVC